MALIPDWVKLHYGKKSGETYVESKKIGDYFVQYLDAEYLGEVKTDIGTYYKYKVKDLATAFNVECNLLSYIS
jgi:hypothetical protein